LILKKIATVAATWKQLREVFFNDVEALTTCGCDADLHWTYPCCPTGNKCVCPDGCYGGDGELYPVGTEWEETGDHECGTKRR